MSDVFVTETDPTPGTLVHAAYQQPDYRDAFKIKTPAGLGVEDFAAEFFLSQPAWLAKVSMNLGARAARVKALADHSFAAGDAVGSWTIHGRDSREIMFGQHMGFMEYRFSMLRRDEESFEASTTVNYLTGLAPIYFTLVKPFHRMFVKRALGTAAAQLAAHGARS